MVLYMAVTKDKYELPIVVTDTLVELAGICGKRPEELSAAIYRARKRNKNYGYVRVEVEEEGERG